MIKKAFQAVLSRLVNPNEHRLKLFVCLFVFECRLHVSSRLLIMNWAGEIPDDAAYMIYVDQMMVSLLKSLYGVVGKVLAFCATDQGSNPGWVISQKCLFH